MIGNRPLFAARLARGAAFLVIAAVCCGLAGCATLDLASRAQIPPRAARSTGP